MQLDSAFKISRLYYKYLVFVLLSYCGSFPPFPFLSPVTSLVQGQSHHPLWVLPLRPWCPCPLRGPDIAGSTIRAWSPSLVFTALLLCLPPNRVHLAPHGSTHTSQSTPSWLGGLTLNPLDYPNPGSYRCSLET
jgi:hypothetical protein